jgi:hypothetical protein
MVNLFQDKTLLELMSFDIAREKEKKLKFFDIFVNDL